MKDNLKIAFFVVVFATVVIGSIFSCINSYTKSNHLKEVCTSQTTGVVIDRIRDTGKSSHGNYRRVMQYEIDGQTYRYIDPGFFPVKPEVGDEVTIYFNPNNLEKVTTEAYSVSYIGNIVLCACAIFVVVGFVLIERNKLGLATLLVTVQLIASLIFVAVIIDPNVDKFGAWVGAVIAIIAFIILFLKNRKNSNQEPQEQDGNKRL